MRTRTHISIGVADLSRSVAFYETVFGAGPTKHLPDFASFRLDTPALHLSLVPTDAKAPGVGTEASHFGVELFDHDHLDAWRARVEAAGLTPVIEEQVTCCYARADKFWLSDPDGRPWEFWVRTAEAESMVGEMPILAPVKAPGCCAPGGEASKAEESGAKSGGCCG